MRALFIFNPYSGKAQVKDYLFDIVDTIVKAGYELEVYPTQCRKDATRVAEERAKDFDLVVCSGGDGTLDEVVTGIIKAGTGTKIGYIPAGSTNDFAASLGIPSFMPDAAKIVAEGTGFACDIEKFNDDYFVYVAAFGAFTDVSYDTPQEVKNVLGHAAYVLRGIKEMQSIRSYRMKFSHDGQTIDGEFLYGMITNSYSVGGMQLTPAKNTELNDGMFEVTLIKLPPNMIELNNVLVALINENAESEYICTFKTNRLIVESDEEIAWTFDGEFGGKHKRAEITNMKEAVTIITPKGKA